MFKTIRVASARSPVTIVGVHSGQTTLPRGLRLDAAARRRATETLKMPDFKADVGETARAAPGPGPGSAGDVLLLGLGKKSSLDAHALRRAGAGLVRRLDRANAKAARLALDGAIPKSVTDSKGAGRCLAEGIGLANWRVDFFDGAASKTSDARASLSLSSDDSALAAGLEEGLTLAECTNTARRIAATPPNICNPTWMAKEARKIVRGTGLSCRVIDFAQATKLGMGGIVNVGKGSASKPCLIVISHKPARAKRGVKLALVGKTMTYDTGGYSLKISNSMKGMKYDGNGGCAVLGAMLAIAALKLPVEVVALLPTAENMVAGDSYRPDDIITMYNGVTVEVTNTDAEGRLILGDALAYACKQVKPTAIIDAATLTGGVVVALGSWCAGLFCENDGLRKRLESAADKTGEKVWRMPLWKAHRDFMRSDHADIWNSGPKRDGHPIQGAAFLSYFVDEKIPWAHLDIAGVSAVDSGRDMFVTGPTGFGVRLLTEVAAMYANGR